MNENSDINRRGEIKRRISRRKTRNYKNIRNENAIINLILEVPYIKLLPSYIIQDLYHSITEKHYRKHEIVLKQGEPISNIYIVKSGTFIFTINHESIYQVSQDINSFIQYQEITKEPFLERRKHELTGHFKNNEEIGIFIYEKKKLFGDIETISGKDYSIFNIYANEDNSSLYIIDRVKWVKLTKRIRISFSQMTLKKIEIIYQRILDVLRGKHYLNIDKMKLFKYKINEQIEITNNFDIYNQKIEKKEKKLKDEFEKFNLNNHNSKINDRERSKSLRNLQNCKNYLLNLFKFPNILKEDVKYNLDKYLFVTKDKDNQKFNLRNTITKFNTEQDLPNNDTISNNDTKNLFMTNLKKPIKNYSSNNIFDKNKKQIKLNFKRNKNETSRANNKIITNSISLINLHKNKEPIFKRKLNKLSTKSILKIKNSSMENINYKNENIFQNKKILNSQIIHDENKKKNLSINPFIQKERNINLHKTITFNYEYKKYKMNKEQIDDILMKRYKYSKDKLLEKLLGKR